MKAYFMLLATLNLLLIPKLEEIYTYIVFYFTYLPQLVEHIRRRNLWMEITSFFIILIIFSLYNLLQMNSYWSRGAVCNCKRCCRFDFLLYHTINSLFWFLALAIIQGVVLSFATQHGMSQEFGGKWRTECLDTRSPLPTLLY